MPAADLIRLGEETFALGRYLRRSNPRHANDPLSLLVRAAKTDPSAAETVARTFATAVARWAPRFDLIVSVPPAPGARFDRFASTRATLARILRAAEDRRLLTMRYPVEHYKRMDHQTRRARTLDRFRAGHPLAGEHCLLLDDVITSGAQTDSCRQALRQAGAARITVLALTVAEDSFLRFGG